MSYLLLILRWIGAFVIACATFLAVIAVGVVVIHPDLGAVFVHVFEILDFLATVLAVALGALVVPRDQRKTAALALWICAVAYPVWPLVTGHLAIDNFLLLGATVLGGGIVYYLVTAASLGGRLLSKR